METGGGAGEQGGGGETSATVEAKGPVVALLEGLQRRGATVLPALRGEWLSGQPQRDFRWQWLDLTGDGRDELLALWQGRPSRPELSEIAVLGLTGESAAIELLLYESLSTRQLPVTELTVVEVTDLTGDQRPDALIHDLSSNQLVVIAAPYATNETIQLFPLPEQCQGSLIVHDPDSDGLMEIVRDGCVASGRLHVAWDGQTFSTVSP
jgi:hypothetical protein